MKCFPGFRLEKMGLPVVGMTEALDCVVCRELCCLALKTSSLASTLHRSLSLGRLMVWACCRLTTVQRLSSSTKDLTS